MATEAPKRRTGLDPIKVFRLFPRAGGLYRASLAAFAIVNGTLLVVSKVDQALLSSWIKLSQPVTASIARVWPAINWAAGELEKVGGVDFIPAVKNVLAFDFILIVLFQALIIPVSLMELGRYQSRIVADMDALIVATGRSLLWFVVVYGVITAVVAVAIYLGVGVRPFALSLQTNYIYFTIDFWLCDTFVPISIVLSTLYCLKQRSAVTIG